MFNKIKTFFTDKFNVLFTVVCILSVVISGGLRIQAGKEYTAQITQLTKSVELQNSKIVELKTANEKLQNINKALIMQLDTKAARVADVKTYITLNNKTICPDVAGTIADTIVRFGDKYNVPTSAIVSVMEVESHFNFAAVGGVGERGLMQVRFNVWKEKLDIKSKYDLHGITIGIASGVQVLNISLKECKYDLKKAFRQYNSGSTSRGSKKYVENVMKSMGEYEAHTALRQIIKDQLKMESKGADSIQNETTKQEQLGNFPSSD